MTTDEYRYAPAPPSPPRACRADLLRPRGRPRGVSPEPAAAGSRSRRRAQVRPYRRHRGPDAARSRLMMNRFAWGHDRDTWADMRKAGGPDAWFEKQLSPERRSRDHDGDLYDGWYPDRMQAAKAKWDDVFAGRKGSVGVRRRPRQLEPAAAQPLHAPAARGDDRLLVQPLPRAVDRTTWPGRGATSTTRRSASTRSAVRRAAARPPACTRRCCST